MITIAKRLLSKHIGIREVVDLRLKKIISSKPGKLVMCMTTYFSKPFKLSCLRIKWEMGLVLKSFLTFRSCPEMGHPKQV